VSAHTYKYTHTSLSECTRECGLWLRRSRMTLCGVTGTPSSELE